MCCLRLSSSRARAWVRRGTVAPPQRYKVPCYSTPGAGFTHGLDTRKKNTAAFFLPFGQTRHKSLLKLERARWMEVSKLRLCCMGYKQRLVIISGVYVPAGDFLADAVILRSTSSSVVESLGHHGFGCK